MFVATPPTIQPPAADDAVAGDGWYPGLTVSAFRDAARISTQVTPGRARAALIGGMISAAAGLERWRAAHEAAGVSSLAATSAAQLAGESRALILWRRAVYAFAAADLVETHSDISATEAGRERRETRAASADDLRRSATVALRDLQGRSRNRVAMV
ncbi:MAG: head completion/stabilization protein [Pseudomonadota bacterium]